jgi:tetratricopeptide (TPR) repeat protein
MLPVICIVLVEGILRLIGVGDPLPLFVQVAGYEQYLVPNKQVGRRYFFQSSVVPSPPHDAFLADKPEGALRLFVQGGSTAAGFPFGHGGMFSRMLRQRLIQTFPGWHIEVINTSMAAVNSYTLLDFSHEIIEQKPDAILIYAGHNEYYGAMGVGSVESPGVGRRLVRSYLYLDRLRIVQAARLVWESLRTVPKLQQDERAEGAPLMEEMVARKTIAYDDRLFEMGVQQFRDNMENLLCQYRDAGIPTYISTLVSNERHLKPFVSRLSTGTDSLGWVEQRQTVRRYLMEGDTVSALDAYSALIDLDPGVSDAWYLRAQLLDVMGRYSEAGEDYIKAKDLDQLRFRAPEKINRVIRESADRCGAHVVDVHGAFSYHAEGGIIGSEFLSEHVHPNLDGYFLLADTFFRALVDRLADDRVARRVPAFRAHQQVLVTTIDSTLAAWNIRRMLNIWPFQERGYSRPDTLEIISVVDSLALRVLRGQQTWLDATAALGEYQEDNGDLRSALRTALAEYQEDNGDLRSALRTALAISDEYHYLSWPFIVAGDLFVKQQRFSTALSYFDAADQREPSIEAKRKAAGVLMRAGIFEDAIPLLERALELDPHDTGTLYDLAVAFTASDRRDDARILVQRVLGRVPGHSGAQRLLESLNGP